MPRSHVYATGDSVEPVADEMAVVAAWPGPGRWILQIGRIMFDPVHRVLWVSGTNQRKELTGKESDVLYLLWTRAGGAVALGELATLWGHAECNPTNPYQKLVGRLRKKLACVTAELQIVACDHAYALLVES